MWPLALAVGVLALAVAIVADALLLLVGRRRHYTLLLVRSFEAIGDTRGMVIRFSNQKTAVDMTVR